MVERNAEVRRRSSMDFIQTFLCGRFGFFRNFLYFYIVRCLIEGLDVDEYDIQVHFHREPENWIDRD